MKKYTVTFHSGRQQVIECISMRPGADISEFYADGRCIAVVSMNTVTSIIET